VVFGGFYILLERLTPPSGQARVDYIAHAGFAWHWRQGQGLLTPHFLFQLLIIICHAISPVNTVMPPAIMAGGVSAAAAALATYAFWIRELPGENAPDYWSAALWSLGLQVAGPITLATIWNNNFYWGYIYPASTYHNPTIVLLKPLAILSFALTLGALQSSMTARPWWPLVLGFAAAGIVSALAKPNWLLCFLPGLVLTIIFDSDLRGRSWAWCVAGAAIVSGLSVLAWQYVFVYGHHEALLDGHREATRIVFTPQKWLSTYGALAPVKLMLSIAFPVSVLLLFWQDLRKSLMLGLAWSTFDASLLVAFGFSETGLRAGDDNLGWSAQIALFVLFVASAIAMVSVLRQPAAADRWRDLGPRRRIAVAIFILHVVGGLTWNATYVMNRGVDWFWY
jgi:hypothetical protein